MKTRITTSFLLGLFFLLCSPNLTLAAIIESQPGGSGNWSDGSTWVGGFAPNPGDDIIINGTVYLNLSTTMNDITVNASGALISLGGTRTLSITGNITNHGTLQSSGYALNLNINGNIYHDGILWANGITSLTGTTDQEIWSSSTFSGSSFNSVVSAKNIIITSDNISFEGCNIDINDVNVVFANGQLSVTGGYITDMVVTANELDITMNDGAYLDDFSCFANYVRLHDLVNIHTDVVFDDNDYEVTVEVVDTLQNTTGGNRLLTVNGNLHNNGYIRNNIYALNIDVAGSVVNSGSWTNYITNLIGDGNQFLTFNAEFAGANFTSNMVEGGIATATNALRFTGTQINFNGDSLYMNAGNDSIFMDGGYMYDITIIAGASPWQIYCYQSNSAYYDNADIEGDDVVFDGTFDILSYFNVKGNARVEGVFQNRSSGSQVASINGNLTNNGTIQDNVYNLTLNVAGDINQNGIWTNNSTFLTGVNDQNFTFTSVFEGANFTSSKPNGKVISHSTLSFNGTTIFFNYDTLMFAAGADSLIFAGSNEYFQEAVITKAASAKTAGFLNITQNDNAYFHDIIIESNTIDLNGTFQFTSPLAFIGHVFVEGILQNRPTSSNSATITGDLTNNGEIKDDVYNCYLYVSGNINQYGTWTNNHVYLNGNSNQEFAFTKTFEATNLTNIKTGGNVIANTTLSFNNSNINFNFDTLIFNTNADSLIFKGNNNYLQEALITKAAAKTPGFLNITMDDNAYFHDVIVESNTIDLNGAFQYTTPMEFIGDVTVEGFLQNRPTGNYAATITGNVTNNGTIQNLVYSNTLYIIGNIAQNGVWSNHYNYLTGTSTQSISSTNPFTCYRIVDNNPASSLEAISDLSFVNTDVDLGGSALTITGDFMVSVTDAWFINTNISSSKCGLTMHGDSYLQNISLENATLYDWVKVRSGCSFSGKTVVLDTLSPYPNITPTVIIDGDITNNGSIQNNSYSLYLEIYGNIINNGLWTNTRTTLNGTTDQSIYLLNDQEITGQVYLDALSAGAPYQWYFDGLILDSPDFTGETSSNLVWQVPVNQSWYGDFYCQTGAGQSRSISVDGGLIVDFAVFLEGPFNGSTMSIDLNTNGLVPLSQPYNVAPWNYSGTESVVSIPADVVDWVLVEFRETSGGPETATSGTMVKQQALFLRNDGKIVQLDGSTEFKVNAPTITNDLYVVVYHRNHLAVMSANPISFDVAPLAYDFSTGMNQAYGSSGQKDIGGGSYGMFAGDGDANNLVQNTDETNVWQPQLNQFGYLNGDFNMNGIVQNNDETSYWRVNLNFASQVP